MARIDWIMQRAVSLIAIGLSLWHLAIVAGFLAYSTIEVRVIHITLLLVLVFLVARPASLAITDDATAKPPRNGLGLGLRLALAATAIGVGVYTYVRWKPIAFSGGLTNDTDALVGLVLIALVMIAVVRRIGWLLAIIAGIFLIYPFVSEYLPSIISTRGYGWERVAIFMSTGTEGIFGIPLGVSASYIIIFTIFGAFLNNFGAGEFFFQLAHAVTRNARAASAKTAVIFSTFLGMISGSAAGNVAVTGTMTIPMMKREGYKPNQAAAIEAAVSTGGQIMPPIMGAAAFIMAEIIGRPYADVMTAALIPALMFFTSILFIVHLQAVKANMVRSPSADEKREPLSKVFLPGLRFLIPFFTLIGMMLSGYSPFRASFVALIVLLAGCVLFEWRDLKAFGLKILKSLEDGALAVMSIAVACAAAGIVAGVLSMTGLGSKISNLIIVLAAGQPLAALGMTAVLAIILGMGLPTTGGLPDPRDGRGPPAGRNGRAASDGAYVRVLLRLHLDDHTACRAGLLRGGRHRGQRYQPDQLDRVRLWHHQLYPAVHVLLRSRAPDGRISGRDRVGRGNRTVGRLLHRVGCRGLPFAPPEHPWPDGSGRIGSVVHVPVLRDGNRRGAPARARAVSGTNGVPARDHVKITARCGP
jgi:TRAP transporter 4TM/12TM fusion protein